MRRLIAVPTVLLALAATSCGDGEAFKFAADPSAPASGRSPAPSGASPTIPGQPVDCGEMPDALGDARSVTLFADPGADGTVGCEEAHDVMSDFFLRAPPESGGTEGSLSVRGWQCQYESGPTGTWVSSCRKDRREMHTEETSQGPGAPSDQPDTPDESRLPPLPEDSQDPMEEPSTEEL